MGTWMGEGEGSKCHPKDMHTVGRAY